MFSKCQGTVTCTCGEKRLLQLLSHLRHHTNVIETLYRCSFGRKEDFVIVSSHHPKQNQTSTTEQACFLISTNGVWPLLFLCCCISFVQIITILYRMLFALLWVSLSEEYNLFGLKTTVLLFKPVLTI